jgi:hypothetical protein
VLIPRDTVTLRESFPLQTPAQVVTPTSLNDALNFLPSEWTQVVSFGSVTVGIVNGELSFACCGFAFGAPSGGKDESEVGRLGLMLCRDSYTVSVRVGCSLLLISIVCSAADRLKRSPSLTGTVSSEYLLTE